MLNCELLLAEVLQFAFEIFREKSQPGEYNDPLHSSSSRSSSTLDWFHNSQNTQQSSQCLEELSKASRSEHIMPSIMKTSAVPSPPRNIGNLKLSQAFRTSSSSHPAVESSYVDFLDNAEHSELSDFVFPYHGLLNKPGGNFTDTRHPETPTFKVPYRNVKPVAKVSGQEAVTVTSDQLLDSHPQETECDGNAIRLTDVNLSTGDDQNAPQKPDLSVDKSSVVAKTPHFRPSYGGVLESSAVTRPVHGSVVNSSASLHDHVGDTPCTLSGMYLENVVNLLGNTILPRFLFQNQYVNRGAC